MRFAAITDEYLMGSILASTRGDMSTRPGEDYCPIRELPARPIETCVGSPVTCINCEPQAVRYTSDQPKTVYLQKVSHDRVDDSVRFFGRSRLRKWCSPGFSVLLVLPRVYADGGLRHLTPQQNRRRGQTLCVGWH